MSDNFLEKILEHKRRQNEKKAEYYATLKKKVQEEEFNRYHLFKNAISRPGQINLIGEIKRASPSRGPLRQDFEVLKLAKMYVEQGAAALSILTEEKYFLGKPMYVTQVSENYSIPVLTKDFIIHEGQLYETFSCGSSAVLLITAVLSKAQLKHFLAVSHRLDLDCLVEVHDEKELEQALAAGAEIIGINNRNLRTFDIDLKVSERMIPKVPKDKIIVAESGIKTHAEVEMLKALGAHAVLIGETFMRCADMEKKIKEVMYGQTG